MNRYIFRIILILFIYDLLKKKFFDLTQFHLLGCKNLESNDIK